jgi:predicted ester cyclase
MTTDAAVEANKALVMRAITEGFNGGNLDIADEIFTDDYTVHAPGLNELPTGPAAFKAAIGLWRNAFSNIHMDVQLLIGEGEFVCNRFVTKGTHDGPLFGVQPTGRDIVVRGMEIHRIVDGKVVESWIGDDVPTIMMQIGAAGGPGGPKH